jgi:NAD(P)-dependent dehydrogenase (short-subunit alcohol dehydrogenase family)
MASSCTGALLPFVVVLAALCALTIRVLIVCERSCFGTNYVGHVMLTLLLLPALKREPPSRVIAVSSVTHTLGANESSAA